MRQTLVNLETKFWQSMVDQDTDTALSLLCEPAVMASAHGAMKFDHIGYKKMAEEGTMVLTAFKFSDMEVVFPNQATAVLMYHVSQTIGFRGKTESITQEMTDSSTWVQDGSDWLCVAHTETPCETKVVS
jgi:hypothetical protein